MSTITMFRDFLEDKRTSMEVYADNLSSAIMPLLDDKFTLKKYHPVALPLTGISRKIDLWLMRLSRYIAFPLQAGRHKGALNHILDHGYAHLLSVLPPEKTIITVHDIIPLLRGKGCIFGIERDAWPWLNEYSIRFLKKAKHIIAISQNTKSDIINHCGCKEENISVVYYGINKKFKLLNNRTKIRHAFNFPNSNTYLILVVGLGFYKNSLTSLKVLKLLKTYCKKKVKLVYLGQVNSECKKLIKNNLLKQDIIELDFVPHDKMVELYNAVDCMLFPSWYEGFGLPPLEAMACGIPAVTSNVASLPEAVGDACLMAKPDDVDSLAEAVCAVLENNELRDALIKKGVAWAKRFTWERNASETLKIYKQVLTGEV